jgi:endogenous inhibitor of DNA gyrase (YacG/DUF329 family)
MPERPCPVCGKRAAPRGPKSVHPFCAERCRQVDLGRWFSGAYAVPATEAEDDAEGEAPRGA